ncbi:hypothetical protein QAD11_21225 [Stenotrophomonas maltophilia]|nr:hypothetical protein [Stenotrophomonas maltophilia]MDH7621102.1 hypothetical protein [Stenotrophomonas maltophilia]
MTRGLGLRFALLTGMAIGLVALSALIQELQAASTAWLTGMAIGLVALSALIQELQAASTAWIAGQGYWSRGQQDATAALSRYLARGHAQDLDDARQALRIPLGDLQARLALEQAVPDEEKARQGFLQGGNARADIPRLVFSFRYARDIGAFREATTLCCGDRPTMICWPCSGWLPSCSRGTPKACCQRRTAIGTCNNCVIWTGGCRCRRRHFRKRCCAWPRWYGSPRLWWAGCRCWRSA